LEELILVTLLVCFLAIDSLISKVSQSRIYMLPILSPTQTSLVNSLKAKQSGSYSVGSFEANEVKPSVSILEMLLLWNNT